MFHVEHYTTPQNHLQILQEPCNITPSIQHNQELRNHKNYNKVAQRIIKNVFSIPIQALVVYPTLNTKNKLTSTPYQPMVPRGTYSIIHSSKTLYYNHLFHVEQTSI